MPVAAGIGGGVYAYRRNAQRRSPMREPGIDPDHCPGAGSKAAMSCRTERRGNDCGAQSDGDACAALRARALHPTAERRATPDALSASPSAIQLCSSQSL